MRRHTLRLPLAFTEEIFDSVHATYWLTM